MHDDERSGRLSPVNDDLMHAVEEKIRENRRFTITSLSLHFPDISRSLLHEIMSEKLNYQNRKYMYIMCMLDAKDAYGRIQNETAEQCVDLFDTIRRTKRRLLESYYHWGRFMHMNVARNP